MNLRTLLIAVLVLACSTAAWAYSAPGATKHCGNCNSPVSASAEVGDKCPHCGVYWGREDETEKDARAFREAEVERRRNKKPPGIVGRVLGWLFFGAVVIVAVGAGCTGISRAYGTIKNSHGPERYYYLLIVVASAILIIYLFAVLFFDIGEV